MGAVPEFAIAPSESNDVAVSATSFSPMTTTLPWRMPAFAQAVAGSKRLRRQPCQLPSAG
jgi:hypothetical protein